MGYDMTIRGDVPKDLTEEELEKAYAAVDSLEPGDARYAAWTEWHKLAHPEYFRLNIWGMASYRLAMLELNMVHPSADPVDQDEWPIYPEDDGDAESMAAYEAKHAELVSRHGEGPAETIPSFKLCSNDGWIVTPDEINAALVEWDVAQIYLSDLSPETRETIESDYWKQWIGYLQLAAQHDGFEVH